MKSFCKTALPVFLASLICVAFWTLSLPAAEPPAISLVPIPSRLEIRDGCMTLTPQSKVVASSTELSTAAEVVADELRQLVGLELAVTTSPWQPGDIVLALAPTLEAESYTIDVGTAAVVQAGNPLSLVRATTTLMQALIRTEAGAALPRMLIEDQPAVAYRGLMIDCARNRHSLKTLKQMIILCRWYKVRYLHLHLTDDQAFTFPSKALPELCTNSFHYLLEDLREIESYARDRGVIIIPELDVPGHATSLVQAMPKLFGTNPPPKKDDPWQAICVGREVVYRALDTLVGEMCAVFPSSPYFHIGADEVNHRSWENCADTQTYMAANRIESLDELYRHFIVRMNEIVKKHGKQMIVWEGFSKEGHIEIPRDIVVMVFECKYNLPPDLLADGYQIINTAWQPLYVTPGYHWPPEHIYGWNHYRWESPWEVSEAYKNPIVVAPKEQVIGAQLCSWEQVEDAELASLRHRLAAMSERVWNPAASRSFADFSQRLETADRQLDSLLKPERHVRVEER